MAKKKRYDAGKKLKRKPNTQVRNPGKSFKKIASKSTCKISCSNVSNVTDSRANFVRTDASSHVFVLLERLSQNDILLSTTPKESSSKVSKTKLPEECILPSTTEIESCHKISNSTLMLPENCALPSSKSKKSSSKVSKGNLAKPEESILPSTMTAEPSPKISKTMPVLSEKSVLPSTTAKESSSKVSKTKSVFSEKFIGICKETRKSSSKILKTKSVAPQEECILPSTTPVESSPKISNTTPTLPKNIIYPIRKAEKSSLKISNTDSMLPEVCIPPSTTPTQSSSRICKTKSALPKKCIGKSAKAIKSRSKISSPKSVVSEKVILPSTKTRQSSCKVSKTNLPSPQITQDPIEECPSVPKLNDSVEVAESSQVSGENKNESPIIQHERNCPSANDSDSGQLSEARQATSPLLTLSVCIDGNESHQDSNEPSESPCPDFFNVNSSSSASCTDIDTDVQVQVEPLLQSGRKPVAEADADEHTMEGLNREVVVANITPHPNGHDEISFHTSYEPLLPQQRSKPKPTYTPHAIVPNPQNNDNETVNLNSKSKFAFNPVTDRSQNFHNIPPRRPPVPVAPANNIDENQRVLSESLPTPTPSPTSMTFSPLLIREDTYEALSHNTKYQPPPPSSQKKYKCFACGDAFRLNLDLREHVIIRHSVICMIYKCTICDRIFCRKEELIDHMDEHCRLNSSLTGTGTGGYILHPDPTNAPENIEMIDLDDSLTNPNGIQNGCDPFLSELISSQENNNSNPFQNIHSSEVATYSEEMQMDDSVYITNDSQSQDQDQLFQIEAYGNENSFELPTNDELESIIAISRPSSPAASLFSPPEEVVLEDEDEEDQVNGDENENVTNNNNIMSSTTLNFSYIGAPSFNNIGSFHHKTKKRKKSSSTPEVSTPPSLHSRQLLFPTIEQKPFSLHCQGQDKNQPLEGNTSNIPNSPIRVAQKHYNVRERSSNIDYGETQICNKCDKDFLTAEELDDHAKLCRVGVTSTKSLNRRR